MSANVPSPREKGPVRREEQVSSGSKGRYRRGRSSLVDPYSETHSEGVSMYVSLLSDALGRAETGFDDDALLAHVRKCRTAVPADGPRIGGSWLAALCEEVAYDCGLVQLADRHGIDVAAVDYVSPRIEREYLEVELRRRGIDVASDSPGMPSQG